MKSRYAYGAKIEYANDLARDRLNARAVYMDMVIKQLIALGNSGLIETVKKKPIGKKVYAIVNHSRWIAYCDYCGSASAVQPDDGFFCLTCLNIKNDNRSRPVVFPDNYKEIEILLEKRELPRDRNWLIGEPLENLIIENAALKGILV
jgi:putative transposon-encoded protein